MKSRCYNKNFPRYSDYGGRGIKVSTKWKRYQNFKNWAINNGYKNNLTIDRINNKLDYSPKNCRWITYSEQSSNKRNNHKFNAFGESKILSLWSKDVRCKVSLELLTSRVYRKWDVEKAITEPTLITWNRHTSRKFEL